MKVVPVWYSPLIRVSPRYSRKNGPADRLRVGVLSLVMLSVWLVPVSLAASRSAGEGAPGAAVSITTLRASDCGLTSPVAETTAAVIWRVPSARGEVVTLQLPSDPTGPLPTSTPSA